MPGLPIYHTMTRHSDRVPMYSDARTGNVVDDRIRPAVESGSTVGKTKPVLVVVDEIDGATGAGENVSSWTGNYSYNLLTVYRRWAVLSRS
jgi:hypothetical protein